MLYETQIAENLQKLPEKYQNFLQNDTEHFLKNIVKFIFYDGMIPTKEKGKFVDFEEVEKENVIIVEWKKRNLVLANN